MRNETFRPCPAGMRRVLKWMVLLAGVFTFGGNGWSASSGMVPSKTDGHETAVNARLSLDFSDYAEGPVEEWLRSKGFVFEQDAKNRRLIRLDLSEEGLVIEAKKQARGLLVKQLTSAERYSAVRLKWGVLKYPKGASYEEGVNNEALMVYLFFGHEEMPSGNFLLPDSPYFIGLFLGNREKINKPYVGNYYREGGRFVCLGNPAPGEIVSSEFDLAEAYRKYFKKEKVPAITGISLGVDTTSAGDGGRSGAIIKSIEFFR